MKSLIVKLWLYIKYPLSLKMDLHKLVSWRQYKKLRLDGFPPNYIYFNRFLENSTIIDVGCGYAAEFSTTLIDQFHLKAFAVDPTKKHEPLLKEIEKKYPNHFTHFPLALSSENGETIFFESQENESGSLFKTHQNIMSDTISSYNVQLVDLPTLIGKTGAEKIEILKIDIEGAEFELFTAKNLEALGMVNQLFVEFHHHSMKNRSKKDTINVVRKIEKEGFNVFSYDGVNYLFFRDSYK